MGRIPSLGFLGAMRREEQINLLAWSITGDHATRYRVKHYSH